MINSFDQIHIFIHLHCSDLIGNLFTIAESVNHLLRSTLLDFQILFRSVNWGDIVWIELEFFLFCGFELGAVGVWDIIDILSFLVLDLNFGVWNLLRILIKEVVIIWGFVWFWRWLPYLRSVRSWRSSMDKLLIFFELYRKHFQLFVSIIYVFYLYRYINMYMYLHLCSYTRNFQKLIVGILINAPFVSLLNDYISA